MQVLLTKVMNRPIPYNFMTRHVNVSFSKKRLSSVAQKLKSDLGRLFVEVYRSHTIRQTDTKTFF